MYIRTCALGRAGCTMSVCCKLTKRLWLLASRIPWLACANCRAPGLNRATGGGPVAWNAVPPRWASGLTRSVVAATIVTIMRRDVRALRQAGVRVLQRSGARACLNATMTARQGVRVQPPTGGPRRHVLAAMPMAKIAPSGDPSVHAFLRVARPTKTLWRNAAKKRAHRRTLRRVPLNLLPRTTIRRVVRCGDSCLRAILNRRNNPRALLVAKRHRPGARVRRVCPCGRPVRPLREDRVHPCANSVRRVPVRGGDSFLHLRASVTSRSLIGWPTWMIAHCPGVRVTITPLVAVRCHRVAVTRMPNANRAAFLVVRDVIRLASA